MGFEGGAGDDERSGMMDRGGREGLLFFTGDPLFSNDKRSVLMDGVGLVMENVASNTLWGKMGSSGSDTAM